MKRGDRVKVVRCVDPGVPIEPRYMGKVGVIRKGGDGSSVDLMVSVEFADGAHDAFWPEELEAAQ